MDSGHEGKLSARYSLVRGVHGQQCQQRSQLIVDVMKSSIFIHLKHRGTERDRLC
jgi:hypothetical protein